VPAPAKTPRRRSTGKHVSPQPVTVAQDDVAVTALPEAPASQPSQDTPGADAWPEVMVLPDPERAKVATGAAHGPDSDDDVLDVLHRLVPEPESPAPLDDPGDLRARLARTAALKKPGSRERQEERDTQEGPAQQ
jgi:hypothetical protein